ncbi:hypothetical protein JXB31_00005 [Candidatus Woesearchaeota archaeon]|nr:hypothetical protein [Candidatus Woesearchaeota archaeon]
MTPQNSQHIGRVAFLVMLLLAITALSACEKNNEEDYPITDKEFKRGTDGLEIEFLKSAPPGTTIENMEFRVICRVYNRGGYDTSNVYLTASLERDYMCITTDSIDDNGNKACAEYSDEDKEKIQKITELRKKFPELNAQLALVESQLELENKKSEKDDNELLRLESEIKKKKQEIQENVEEIAKIEETLTLISKYFTKDAGIMRGRSIYYPEGSPKEIIFDARTKMIDALSTRHTSTVALTACYSYTTEIGDDICIDTDIYGTGILNKVCTLEEHSYSGQGAPVVIEGIKITMLPHGTEGVVPQFIISVKNKGNGNVIATEKVKHACSATGLNRDDWNTVNLTTFRFTYKGREYTNTDGSITCKKNPITLEDNKGEIRCTLKDEFSIPKSEPAFITQFFVKLDYGYTFTISKDVVIEKQLI